MNKTWSALAALMLPGLALASSAASTEATRLDLTNSGIGFFAIVVFVFAYALVLVVLCYQLVQPPVLH